MTVMVAQCPGEASASEQRDAAQRLLRLGLERAFGVRPTEIELERNSFGKPRLRGRPGVHFNIAHCRRAVVVLVADRPVGVDVEFVRQGPEFSRIAERFFTAKEAEALRNCPAHLQAEAFFRCWTRKEAFIKASGEGFARGLASFEVSIEPGDSDALLGASDDPAAVERWHLANVDAAAGCAAAVAVAQRGLAFACWEWPGE